MTLSKNPLFTRQEAIAFAVLAFVIFLLLPAALDNLSLIHI